MPRLPTFTLLPRLGRLWLIALIGWGGSAHVDAAEAWRLPPIDGEISGEFAFRPDEAGPVARWTLGARTEASRERRARFQVEGAGLKLAGEAELDAAGEGAWRLTEGEVDLGIWFAAAVSVLGPEFADLSGQGTLVAAGDGTLGVEGLRGRARISVRDARVELPSRKLQLEGISVTVEFEDVGTRRSVPAQTLTWRSGRYDVLVLGPGRIVFDLEDDVLRVEQATLEVLGGEVVIDAFAVSAAKPNFTVTARLLGIDIAELKKFIPPVLTSARGRVDGEVTLFRTIEGIEIGPGRLTLRKGATAELRLAPTPGLLSASLPATVMKHYPGLAMIELGEVPLRADLLEVTFTPGGDESGRSASVHVMGGPEDPKLRAPIDLNINVRGPLEALLKFGTHSRLRFGDAK